MSKRKRLPLAVIPGGIARPVAVKSIPVSDKARLVWQEFHAPIMGAYQALQQALANAEVCMGKRLAELDGIPADEGYTLNVQKMTWDRPKR